MPEKCIIILYVKHTTRFLRQINKQKIKEFKGEELNIEANLQKPTIGLHEDVYNEVKHGEVNQLRYNLEEITREKTRVRLSNLKLSDKNNLEMNAYLKCSN